MRLEALLGPAGSGKSYLLQERLKADRKYAILSATTGIAAINLGPMVTTVNSTLGFYDAEDLEGKQREVRDKLVELAYEARALVIDEISMMSAETLDLLFGCYKAALDILRIKRNGKPSNFGLLVCGDYLQLPPVKGRYAFQAECWERFKVTKLETIYRQQDPKFSEALKLARGGSGIRTVQKLIESGVKFVELPDTDFVGTTLYPINASVEKHNREAYTKLEGEEVLISSKKWGQQKGEWKLIPDRLGLKVGAKVMALANKKGDSGLLYANGSVGEIVSVFDDKRGVGFDVSFPSSDYLGPIDPVERTNKHKKRPQGIQSYEWEGPEKPSEGAEPKEWAIFLREYAAYVERAKRDFAAYQDADSGFWITGTITYVPVRLAYALSFHKAQGLTLDQVQVDCRSLMAGKEGMLYVAMSRARSPEGLQLVGTKMQVAKRILTNPAVREWV